MHQSEIRASQDVIDHEAQHHVETEAEAGVVLDVAGEIDRYHSGPVDAPEAAPAVQESIATFQVPQIDERATIETEAEIAIATRTETETEIEIEIVTESASAIETVIETETETVIANVIAIAIVIVSVPSAIESASETVTVIVTVTATAIAIENENENENQTETETKIIVVMLSENHSATAIATATVSARNITLLILTATYHLLVTELAKSTTLPDIGMRSPLNVMVMEGAEIGSMMIEIVTEPQIAVEREIDLTIVIVAGRGVVKESEMFRGAEAEVRVRCHIDDRYRRV